MPKNFCKRFLLVFIKLGGVCFPTKGYIANVMYKCIPQRSKLN